MIRFKVGMGFVCCRNRKKTIVFWIWYFEIKIKKSWRCIKRAFCRLEDGVWFIL